jgi:hypothetical protein
MNDVRDLQSGERSSREVVLDELAGRAEVGLIEPVEQLRPPQLGRDRLAGASDAGAEHAFVPGLEPVPVCEVSAALDVLPGPEHVPEDELLVVEAQCSVEHVGRLGLVDHDCQACCCGQRCCGLGGAEEDPALVRVHIGLGGGGAGLERSVPGARYRVERARTRGAPLLLSSFSDAPY